MGYDLPARKSNMNEEYARLFIAFAFSALPLCEEKISFHKAKRRTKNDVALSGFEEGILCTRPLFSVVRRAVQLCRCVTDPRRPQYDAF